MRMAIDFACKKFDILEVVKCSLGLTKVELELFRFFLHHKESFSSAQLAKKLKVDVSTVQRGVKKLYEVGVIIRNQENLSNGGYVFAYCIADKKKITALVKQIVHTWVSTVESELEKI